MLRYSWLLLLILFAIPAFAGPLDVLKAEIDGDPLVRGYAGMTNQQIADDINTAYRDNWRPISSSQLFEAIDSTEFVALSDANKSRVDRLLGLGENIQTAPGSKSRAELVAVFGGGSQTAANLLPIANPGQTRGQELGIGFVRVGQVAEAKALP